MLQHFVMFSNFQCVPVFLIDGREGTQILASLDPLTESP